VAVDEIPQTERARVLHPHLKEILEVTLAEILLVVVMAELVAAGHPPLEWIGLHQAQQPQAALERHHQFQVLLLPMRAVAVAVLMKVVEKQMALAAREAAALEAVAYQP
jgi:hypothetical protein